MKFRIGINYWPTSSAMYWWQRFDPEEVRQDFQRIRRAGFDSVRVFLLWEDFQPTPDRVSEKAVDHLIRVADIAAAHGLSLLPTLFTGHMSGVNWIPQWALGRDSERSRFRTVSGGRVVHRSIRNWYVDQDVARAQGLLAREVASALHQHPALWGWDLGNEASNCVVPPTREAGLRWLDSIASSIKSVDSSHPITMGLHMEDLEEDRRIGPAEAAHVCDFLCMHGYPVYASWARGPEDEMLLPFLGLITRWLGDRDVLLEEFGAPAVSTQASVDRAIGPVVVLREDAAAAFVRRALDALLRFGFQGAMVWCYGDYDLQLWDRPPLDQAVHERYFGLWRADNSPKAAVAEIAHLAGCERRSGADDLGWIDMSARDFYADPARNLGRLYRRFLERCGQA